MAAGSLRETVNWMPATTIEAIMPDGKALQAGTSHYLGENFSKHFDVSYLDKDGKSQNVHTTSWGISTRLLGAIVMLDSDDKGLILPPKIAPIQIVIIPIFYSDEDKASVSKVALELMEKLKKKGVAVKFDDREGRSPGYKFNHWELKGVPLRIELGPRDLKENSAVMARRDTGEKNTVKLEVVVSEAVKTLKAIQKNMLKRNKDTMNSLLFSASTYEAFKEKVTKGFVKVSWCGSVECEEKIKLETTATTRLIPFDEKKKGNCIYCKKDTEIVVYFARSY